MMVIGLVFGKDNEQHWMYCVEHELDQGLFCGSYIEHVTLWVSIPLFCPPQKFNFLLPIIKKNNSMKFYKWKKNGVLLINKYGIPEPVETKEIIPSIVLLPLLAYDKNKNRIGYGKGFYDKFLNKFLKTRKKILTIGVAFSFQKHHKLPINQNDVKLDFILTDKGIY